VRNISIEDTAISGVKVLRRRQHKDHRGFLERLFCDEELAGLFVGKKIKQVNLTNTKLAGSVRGLHFQLPPHCEMKLVSCLRGEVWDVALDLRSGSPTFLQYHHELLSGQNQTSLLLPEGVAHGFQTMCDDCDILYMHSELYRPESEGGVRPLDKNLRIEWPKPLTDISERDRSHPPITDVFKGIKL
jgi:dTDP-4-dehydrorhamnose 3,5-epimerase